VSLLAIAVICTAIGIGVGVSGAVLAANLTHHHQSGLSSDTTVTQEQLQGEYYGTEGGIHFTSTVNATYTIHLITTTSGEHVVYIVHSVTGFQHDNDEYQRY
jgi:hypothetical protein